MSQQSKPSSVVQVIFPQEGEAWSALTRRMKETEGELLLILSGRELELIAQPDTRSTFLAECKKQHQRLRIATKHPAIAAEARAQGIRVLDRTKHMRALLHGNPRLDDALRVFSPQLWRQQLKSQMQRMGLLSVPKMRIFSLVALSIGLFCVVVFRLLPSADVYIRPRQESVSQTGNIFLVQSGAVANVSNRVRRMPLIPIDVTFKKTLTFDHISKEFIGTSAQVELTVINKASETYALREGTRFKNQAGMIFRILDHAIVDPAKEVIVRAKADDLDLYGEIIGDRGNVPAGLKWDVPGLALEEQALVYAENRKPATGGKTAFRTVLRQEDLDLARKRLEQELLTTAKQMVDERVQAYNDQHPNGKLQLLNYGELTKSTFSGMTLPTQFIGQEITSVPVEGSINYSMYAYDSEAIVQILHAELSSHIREGRRLIDRQISSNNLDVRVIEYDDSFLWVKVTVELVGTEEYVLDPLSAEGAIFAKKVREQVAGKPREEALRIIRNMPEVERADIRQWPPWNTTLPRIAAHIAILPF